MVTTATYSPPIIIFDFDGTIADSLGVGIDIYNEIAPAYNVKTIAESQYEACQNMSGQELIKSLGISKLKLPFILRKIKSELRKNMSNLPLNDGMKECILNLRSMGYELGIITSNSKDNVMNYLQQHDLSKAFDFVYSCSSLFGKHKVIKKVMKKHNFNQAQTLYVGDESRDVEAAQKSNIKVIAVTWGGNSRRMLQRFNPDHIADDTCELVEAVKSFGLFRKR